MELGTLSQNRAMEGDAVLDRVVQLERLVMEKFAEMKADNQELRQTLQEMGERLASANQQAAAGHHDAISVDAPAERASVDVVVKKEEGPPRKTGPQMGEDESQSIVGGRASAARAGDKETTGGGPAEKAKKGAVSRRVAKEFLDEGIRQNSSESTGEAKSAGG